MAKKFDKRKLPRLAGNLHATQQLLKRNVEDSLLDKSSEIENALTRADLIAEWKAVLHDKYGDLSDALIDEIFIDVWLSVNFACTGLYKQAHVCLRASLEMTLRLVYFSKHPIEYSWWCDGKSEDLKDKNSRGEDRSYFGRLESFQKFEKTAKKSGKAVPKLIDKIKNEYSQLSKYVHGNKDRFQTGKKISPKYVMGEFNKWNKHFNDIITYMNTVLMLGFSEEVKAKNLATKKKLLKNISIANYKSFLRKTLPIKFKGR
jgi:hypothetical protein